MQFLLYAALLLTVIGSITSLLRSKDLKFIINEYNSKENSADGGVWAVLVATSKGFANYRHQAEILHAYHLFADFGIPKNQIITMMYDDIAYSPENFYDGQVFSFPGGKNVYSGAKIDYREEDVSARNFMRILKSDSTLKQQNKAVLESKENDTVIIYLAGHGGYRVLDFPNDMLYGRQFASAIQYMEEHKMYKNMLILGEAALAGSLFLSIASRTNIQILQAADWKNDSFSCFYDYTLKTFMVDCFSIDWLVNNDGGWHRFIDVETTQRVLNLLKTEKPVKQGDIAYAVLKKQFLSDPSQEMLAKMLDVQELKKTVNLLLKSIILRINSSSSFLEEIETYSKESIDFYCYRSLLERFQRSCSHIVDFHSYHASLQFYKFANLCRGKVDIQRSEDAIDTECKASN